MWELKSISTSIFLKKVSNTDYSLSLKIILLTVGSYKKFSHFKLMILNEKEGSGEEVIAKNNNKILCNDEILLKIKKLKGI